MLRRGAEVRGIIARQSCKPSRRLLGCLLVHAGVPMGRDIVYSGIVPCAPFDGPLRDMTLFEWKRGL